MKLISSGINSNILDVIFNLYNGVKSCVKMNGNLYDYFKCNIGVRQGENLRPLLFAIFLNYFEHSISRSYSGLNLRAADVNFCLSDGDVEHFLKIYTLLYADDTVVLAELQLALNAIHYYCSDWILTMNPAKIEIVIFFKAYNVELPSIYVLACPFGSGR